MKQILFDKTKANSKAAFIFLLFSLLSIFAFQFVKHSFFSIVVLILLIISVSLSYRYFNFHKHAYIKYDQSTLYVYCGVFRKLKSVRLSTISVVLIVGSKIKLLTKDGIEITLNCLEISKQDVKQLKSYLKQCIKQEKWAL